MKSKKGHMEEYVHVTFYHVDVAEQHSFVYDYADNAM
jgi:hypothetical protein